MTLLAVDADVLVAGGGRAGTVAASLLAEREHSVFLATQPRLREHGLANSLPPSVPSVELFGAAGRECGYLSALAELIAFQQLATDPSLA